MKTAAAWIKEHRPCEPLPEGCFTHGLLVEQYQAVQLDAYRAGMEQADELIADAVRRGASISRVEFGREMLYRIRQASKTAQLP